jgi:hypothetical protein
MNGGIAGAVAAVALAVLGGCSQPAVSPPVPPAPPAAPLAPAARPAAGNPPAPPAPKENLEPSPIDRTGLPPLSDAGTLALKVLLRAHRFTSDAVGDGGGCPLEVECLRVLFQQRAAKEAFRHLFENGTTAGRLFGLCGLWYADPAAFEKDCAAFLEEHGEETVATQMGCILEEVPVGPLVRNPEPKGAVRLKDRTQTVKQWCAEAKVDGADYDIAGGGWPCVLRTGGGW